MDISALDVFNEIVHREFTVNQGRCVKLAEGVEESGLHLFIRIVKIVCVETFVVALYRQVAGLVHKGYRCWTHIVCAGQCLYRNLVLGNVFQIVSALLEVSDEERWRASLEPVHAEFLGLECV